MRRASLILAGFFGPLAVLCVARADEPRYAVEWIDGTRTSADEVQNWFGPDPRPALASHLLWDPRVPARWLRDNRQPPATTPGAYVELVGGECFPGKVVGAAIAAADSYETLPPCLLVEPGCEVDLPGMPPRARIRILSDFVERIVWTGSSHRPYQPGTLFYIDGRRTAFRSLRWSDAGVRLLGEQGLATAALTDIAEIHLPAPDAWALHARRLAILAPGGQSRLTQLETSDGLKLISSVERTKTRVLGEAPNADNWTHVVQPAWSPDAFFLKHRKVREWQFFSPQELPLSWVGISASRHTAAFSGPWSHPRVNTNVQGAALAAGGLPFAWGLGVHAQHELEFAVPPQVTAFHARAGLDRAAGAGGCVQARVRLDDRVLFESPLLVGSNKVVDTGRLALKPSSASSRLVLVADAAGVHTPPGADPLDIRDVFDWLEPYFELGGTALRLAIDQQAVAALPALGEWTIDGSYGNDWKTVNVFDPDERQLPGFQLGIVPLSGPLVVSRTLHVEKDREALTVLLGRYGTIASSSRVIVRVNGHKLDEVPIPTWRDGGWRRPLVVKLNGYGGRDVEIEFEIVPDDDRSIIQWQGYALLAKPPEAPHADAAAEADVEQPGKSPGS